MGDIDPETLRSYRQNFRNMNIDHVWEDLDDKTFLENLGGYRTDRKNKAEGLTMAGLLMFGKGLAVRDAFSTVFMDYREETDVSVDVRWNDRITYDGMWENNLYNFYMRVIQKLIVDIKRPFKLEGMQRVDDTPIHKAIREAFVNAIIHADFLTNGTLKVIKTGNGFRFTNPGVLQIDKEQIYKGGVSKARNPKIQNMFRMIGLGDNIGSGFPSILTAWQNEGWVLPDLEEDAINNEVTLILTMEKAALTHANVTDNVTDIVTDPIKKKFPEIELIIADPEITVTELSERLHKNRRTVLRHIKELKELGILERIGSDRKGYWKITDDDELT